MNGNLADKNLFFHQNEKQKFDICPGDALIEGIINKVSTDSSQHYFINTDVNKWSMFIILQILSKTHLKK